MLVSARMTSAQLYSRPDLSLPTLYGGAALTAHGTSRVHTVSASVAPGHARTCKGVVRPKAVPFLSLRRLLTIAEGNSPHLSHSHYSVGRAMRPKHPQSASRRHRKSIGRPQHPPQTPATPFKRLYRYCPGRKNPAQSCLVCRAVPIET